MMSRSRLSDGRPTTVHRWRLAHRAEPQANHFPSRRNDNSNEQWFTKQRRVHRMPVLSLCVAPREPFLHDPLRLTGARRDFHHSLHQALAAAEGAQRALGYVCNETIHLACEEPSRVAPPDL